MDELVGPRPAPALGFTVPEQLGLAGVGAALVAATMQLTTGTIDTGLVCPLRAVTGVPCPLCGMTTSASALADLRLGDAMAANPFFLVLAAATVAMVVVLTVRRLGLLDRARPWGQRAVTRSVVVVALLASGSWIWQLHRFDWI